MRFIPSSVSSTAFLPACEICTERCAPSSTDFAFWLATCAVCLTSSTVVVVSLTPVAVSAAPVAICVVVARISLAEVPSIPMPSRSRPVRVRSFETMVEKEFPRTSPCESGATVTVRSPSAIRCAEVAISRRKLLMVANVRESRPISSRRFGEPPPSWRSPRVIRLATSVSIRSGTVRLRMMSSATTTSRTKAAGMP